MTSKEKIRELLIENRGTYISGEEIAERIFVTRACVWKNIKALQQEGLSIDAVTNKGYRLELSTGYVDPELIKQKLELDSNTDINVEYIPEVTSTNELLKIRAKGSDRTPSLLIAGMQTNGNGRNGRTFYSPADTGLYFSILLYPNTALDKMVNLTALAAVATAKALDEVVFDGADTTKIKWVNDIFINDKKVAGILTEGFTSFESEYDNYIIIGIGINLFAPKGDYPKNLKGIAGSVVASSEVQNGNDNIKNDLIVSIISKLMQLYEECLKGIDSSIDVYRSKSFIMGHYVKINSFDGNNKYAKVIEITDDYRLVVEYEDGSRGELKSGEVSVAKY